MPPEASTTDHLRHTTYYRLQSVHWHGGGDGDVVSGLDSDGGESDTEKRAILGFKTRLAGAKQQDMPLLD